MSPIRKPENVMALLRMTDRALPRWPHHTRGLCLAARLFPSSRNRTRYRFGRADEAKTDRARGAERSSRAEACWRVRRRGQRKRRDAQVADGVTWMRHVNPSTEGDLIPSFISTTRGNFRISSLVSCSAHVPAISCAQAKAAPGAIVVVTGFYALPLRYFRSMPQARFMESESSLGR